MVEFAGKAIGAYEIKERVGRGGMAAVYRAYHPQTERNVAIKVLLPEIAASEQFQKRFEREAKVLAGLQHTHILPVFDYGQIDDVNYLVMPLMPGSTLADQIKTGLSLREINHIFRQLAGAIDYAHRKGILHRDLKPNNIMLDESGNVLIADFGLTRLVGDLHTSQLTSDSTVIGTPAYMSPEQGQGKDLDHRSDLYALGVILYEMFVRDVPFRADTPVAVIFKHISEPLPSINRADVPPTVDAVLGKLMAKLPEDRYDSATQAALDLEAALQLSDSRATPRVHVPPEDASIPVSRPLTDGELNTTQAERLAFDQAVYDEEHPTVTTDFHTEKAKHDAASPKRNRMFVALGGLTALLLITGIVAGILAINSGGSETYALSRPTYEIEDAHEELINDIAISEDGTVVITGSADGRARVWSLLEEDSPERFTLSPGGSNITTVSILPDATEYLTGGQDGNLFRWDGATGSTIQQNIEGVSYTASTYTPNGNYLVDIFNRELSANGRFMPSADDSINLNNPPQGFTMPARVANPNNVPFTALTVSPDSQYIFTGDTTGSIQQWELPDMDQLEPDAILGVPQVTLELIRSVSEHDKSAPGQRVRAVAVNENNDRLASVGIENIIRVVEITDPDQGDFESVAALSAEYGVVYDLAFMPETNIIIAATEEIDVLFWDFNRDQIVYELYTGGSDPRTMAVANSGQLVVGTDDGDVYGWNLRPFIAAYANNS